MKYVKYAIIPLIITTIVLELNYIDFFHYIIKALIITTIVLEQIT